MEYLKILWRKKLLIFLVAASMLIASLLVIRRLPNQYESGAQIVISSQANEERLVPGTPLAALTQQMISRSNLGAIIRLRGLYPNAKDLDASIERLRKEIKLDIKMRNYYPDAPESLMLRYRYTDPVIAQQVMADLVALFEQANFTMHQQAATEVGRLREKIVEVQERMRQLAPHRDLALLRNGGANKDGNDPAGIRAQRLAAASAIEMLSNKEYSLERQIDEQNRQISEQEKLVRAAAPISGPAASSAYGVLLTRKAEIEGQIKDLANTYTDKNPRMIQARIQLAELNRQIEKFEANSGVKSEPAIIASLSPEARELRTMQRELERQKTELEITRHDLNRKTQNLSALPEAEPAADDTALAEQFNETRVEYDRLLSRYNWLMDKQDSLQKLLNGEGAVTAMFQVIDAPHAPKLPVAPNRNLLRLLALGLGLALGLAVAAAREFPRLLLINNDRDVEYYLGTPVLALIPETLTPFERSRRRRLWGVRWLALALLAAAMIPVFVTLLNTIQIFQILATR